MGTNDSGSSFTITPDALGLGTGLGFAGEPSLGGLASTAYAIGSALGLASATGSAPSTSSGPFSTIYAFGDSLSDAGNISRATLGLIPVSPPYSSGRFSNGPVWVQDLAQNLGMTAPGPSLGGGTDFAYGGALTGTVGSHTQNLTDLPSQYAQFIIQDPHPQANALYTVWIGSNDVLSIESEAGQTPANAFAEVRSAVQNEVNFISAMASHGAKDMMVLNVPDLGSTPDLAAYGSGATAAGSMLSQYYDGVLSQDLQPLVKAGTINLDLIDTYGLLDGVISNPGPFGFSNVKSPLWTGNFTSSSSGTLQSSAPAGKTGYLFFDTLHPTSEGHSLLGQYAASTVAHAFA